MNSQSILPASCTSSCLMLMIWSSRARNRSPDPVVSCFFGRIAPSDAATESCFSIRGNRENELQASKASDTETLQSQVNKAAKKRLSLSGLEILHGRPNGLRQVDLFANKFRRAERKRITLNPVTAGPGVRHLESRNCARI